MRLIRKTGYQLRRALARINRRIRRSDGLAYFLLWLRKFFFYLLVLIFLLFEAVWEVLHDLLVQPRIYAYSIDVINHFCQGQNRYVVLAVYLSLFVPMEMLGLMSAALAASGHIALAGLVYASKGLIAIPAIDVFVANQEKLRSFRLIDWGYQQIQALKHSRTYQSVLKRMRGFTQKLRVYVQQLWGKP